MMRWPRRSRVCAMILSAFTLCAGAAVPSLDAFFQGAQLHSVSVSPNGKRLAMIVTADGKEFVAVKDRTSATPATPVLAPNEKDGFKPSWCRWANDERLLCSFRGRERDKYLNKVFPVTRLVAVNHDGSQQKKLLQNPFQPSGQLNDRIIDWTPEDPRSVLIEKYNPRIGLRVLKLDVYSGETGLYEIGRAYIGSFGTDGHGNVRLGWGRERLKNYYFAKLEGEKEWRELARVTTLSTDEGFRPIAVIRGTNYAYAMRDHEGRSALWKIDLADKEDPALVFASSRVDVRPVYTPDNRILSVLPDSGSQGAFYVEPGAELLGEVLGRLFKGKMYYIQDMTPDMKVVVVMAESDVLAPEFHVLDMSGEKASLQRVGSRFPGLANSELAKTEYVTYPARDGTPIPAYLTRPVNAAGLPPLIVMPHGGPWARDGLGIRQLGAGAGARRLRRPADELSRFRGIRQEVAGGLVQGLGRSAVFGHHRRTEMGRGAETCRSGAGMHGGWQLWRVPGVVGCRARQPLAQVRGERGRRERPARAQERFSLFQQLAGGRGHDRQRSGEARGAVATAARRRDQSALAAAARCRGLHRRAGSVGVHGQGHGRGGQALQDGHDAGHGSLLYDPGPAAPVVHRDHRLRAAVVNAH
jgi:hypothetical protein